MSDTGSSTDSTKIAEGTNRLRGHAAGVVYIVALTFAGVTGGPPFPDWGFTWATFAYLLWLSLVSGFVGGLIMLATTRKPLLTVTRGLRNPVPGAQIGFRIAQAVIVGCLILPFVTKEPTGVFAAFAVVGVAVLLLFIAEDEDSELHMALEEFGDTQTADEAILLLDDIYDEADYARVTFRR